MAVKVRWKQADPGIDPRGLEIWFQYDDRPNFTDKVFILRDMFAAMIGDKPFVIADEANSHGGIWLQAHAKEHALPYTVLRGRYPTVLVGCESVHLLNEHIDHDDLGLAWNSGLMVYVFADDRSLRAQLELWAQSDGSTPFVQSDINDFSLQTQSDGEGLSVFPGLVKSDELLALAERSVRSLGFTWAHFQA